MGTGASIFLIAVGAILTFALEKDIEGIDLDTVGIILMIVGILGLLLTVLLQGRVARTGTTVVEERRSDW